MCFVRLANRYLQIGAEARPPLPTSPFAGMAAMLRVLLFSGCLLLHSGLAGEARERAYRSPVTIPLSE